MKILSEPDLSALLLGSTTIEEDGLGLKVARLADGSFLKLYRRKRLLSSALWSPPSVRFAENAEHLQKLGIPAPNIHELLRVPERQLNGVRYQPLPGDTLRNRWRSLAAEARDQEVEQFGGFLGRLHESGVYFRSLHLGNVLRLPDGELGLIDLSDMTISGHALKAMKRQRNLKHILRYREDTQWLSESHREAWLRGYANHCGQAQAARLGRTIERMVRTRAGKVDC